MLCTSQCESPGSPHGQGILTFEDFFLSKSPPSFAPFVSKSPLFPTPGGGNLFILNVRTAPGSEHPCHNPLCGMSESCQNCLGGGIHWRFTLTGALFTDGAGHSHGSTEFWCLLHPL